MDEDLAHSQEEIHVSTPWLAWLGFITRLTTDTLTLRAPVYQRPSCPDGENGHRRCRAVVVTTSHGVREGRGRAARHRIANSTSGDHRVAAAEGASLGGNRPFGFSPANEWLPMPTAMSPMGNMRSRAVCSRMDVPLGIESRREPRGAAPLSQARHASRRSARSGRGLRRRGRRVRTYGNVEIAG